MGHIRAFLALSLPPRVREDLNTLQQKIRPVLPPVNWVRPENVHVTLKFFGSITSDMVDQLFEALRGMSSLVSPFSLNIQGIGVFPHTRSPRVLWAGLTGSVDRLLELQERIQMVLEPLGFPVEEKSFHPHVTLARIKSDGGKVGRALTAGGVLESQEVVSVLMVDRMVLYRSEISSTGPRYKVLWSHPFVCSSEAV
ncbi:MAG: RNA 2',3'-cyclic phosphodiesterase [Nitrospirales bacterium]|nr:RNA 2',3'-cyclic phosphodiesterase [Nitrospirales bacterium]